MKTPLRVWNIINPPNHPYYHEVESIDDAISTINRLADEQLKDDRIVCNAFGLEAFENGEWEEWVNDNGDCIDDLRDKE